MYPKSTPEVVVNLIRSLLQELGSSIKCVAQCKCVTVSKKKMPIVIIKEITIIGFLTSDKNLVSVFSVPQEIKIININIFYFEKEVRYFTNISHDSKVL